MLVAGLLMMMVTSLSQGPQAAADVSYGQIHACFSFRSGELYDFRPVYVYRKVLHSSGSYGEELLNVINTDNRGCLTVTVRTGREYGMKAFYRPSSQTDCAYNQHVFSGYHLIREARIHEWNLQVKRTMVCTA
jgi:hypothetical protein